jgi:GNAT superfamily N-acetyltransferase
MTGDRMDEPPTSLSKVPDGGRVHSRWADAADAEQVAALVHRLLSEISDRAAVPAIGPGLPELTHTLREMLEHGHYQALMATNGDQLLGVATVAQSHALYAGGAIGVIQEFYVEPAHRSTGVGAQMLSRVQALAERRGWHALELCTPPLPAFDRTQIFYAAHGFHPSGGRKMRWTSP